MSPDRLLSWAVRQLPARREEWGRAMQAELAALQPGAERWRFALSCTRAALTQPATAKWLPAALVVVGAVVLAAGIPVVSVRLEAFAMLVALAAVAWQARRMGPVADGRIARLVSAGSLALVAVAALVFVAGIRRSVPASASAQILVWTAMLSTYLVAATSLTARRTAVCGRALATGAAIGALAAAAWFAVVLLQPSLPTSNGPALLAIAVAAVAAGVQSRIAGLCAAASTALLIAVLIDGPLRLMSPWVATSAPPVYPPDMPYRLVDSIGVWLLGCLFAAALNLVLLRPARARLSRALAG